MRHSQYRRSKRRRINTHMIQNNNTNNNNLIQNEPQSKLYSISSLAKNELDLELEKYWNNTSSDSYSISKSIIFDIINNVCSIDTPVISLETYLDDHPQNHWPLLLPTLIPMPSVSAMHTSIIKHPSIIDISNVSSSNSSVIVISDSSSIASDDIVIKDPSFNTPLKTNVNEKKRKQTSLILADLRNKALLSLSRKKSKSKMNELCPTLDSNVTEFQSLSSKLNEMLSQMNGKINELKKMRNESISAVNHLHSYVDKYSLSNEYHLMLDQLNVPSEVKCLVTDHCKKCRTRRLKKLRKKFHRKCAEF